jgi:hypothetical protein
LNGKQHAIASVIATLIFIVTRSILVMRIDLFLLFKYSLILVIFHAIPDKDKAFDVNFHGITYTYPHRYWLFHSILIPVGFTLSFWGIEGTSFSCFIVGLHLILDTYQPRGKKKQGYYLIHFGNRKTLGARSTDTWLWTNGLIGVFFAFILDVGGTLT